MVWLAGTANLLTQAVCSSATYPEVGGCLAKNLTNGAAFTREGKLVRSGKAEAALSQIGFAGCMGRSFRRPLGRIGDPQISPTRQNYCVVGYVIRYCFDLRIWTLILLAFRCDGRKSHRSLRLPERAHASAGRGHSVGVAPATWRKTLEGACRSKIHRQSQYRSCASTCSSSSPPEPANLPPCCAIIAGSLFKLRRGHESLQRGSTPGEGAATRRYPHSRVPVYFR